MKSLLWAAPATDVHAPRRCLRYRLRSHPLAASHPPPFASGLKIEIATGTNRTDARRKGIIIASPENPEKGGSKKSHRHYQVHDLPYRAKAHAVSATICTACASSCLQTPCNCFNNTGCCSIMCTLAAPWKPLQNPVPRCRSKHRRTASRQILAKPVEQGFTHPIRSWAQAGWHTWPLGHRQFASPPLTTNNPYNTRQCIGRLSRPRSRRGSS